MSVDAASLTRSRRERELAALTGGAVVDLLVVGGGVTGAGVALDAATRGLRVVLVEAEDLAFGTSRWSSKLVHGGLRYLATGDLSLARESARERRILMEHTAPHLVHPLPFVLPFTSSFSPRSAAVTTLGIRVGDGLRLASGTRRSTLPGPRRLTAPEVLGLAPALDPVGLRGGLLTWDGQLADDARLVVGLARTAAAYGAAILTHCRVGSVSGRVGAHEVAIRDGLTGEAGVLRARHVVNATGVWAGDLEPTVTLAPSRGSHLVLDRTALPGLTTGLMLPVPTEANRFLLVLPQPDGPVYLGLTDDPVAVREDVPTVPPQDEEFLLRVASAVLARDLTAADVVGRFAGLRPLLAGEAGRSADLSRRHAVLEGTDGLLTLTGGKLTTYRAMAADAVDRVVARAGVTAGPCVTERLPLVGAARRTELSSAAAPVRLVRRYGSEAVRVMALARTHPELADPVPGTTTLGVELAFAVAHEGALTVADAVERRTRLSLVDGHGEAARPLVEKLLADSAP